MSKRSDKEIVEEGIFGEVIVRESFRPNGSLRYSLDFSNCPSMAEQHTAHLTDINYLIEKYKPDELVAYMHARAQYRREILGHDFVREPSMQDALNVVYRLKQAFQELPVEITGQFRNHLEFVKFIDNPDNADKLVRMGLMKPKEVIANSTDADLVATRSGVSSSSSSNTAKTSASDS